MKLGAYTPCEGFVPVTRAILDSGYISLSGTGISRLEKGVRKGGIDVRAPIQALLYEMISPFRAGWFGAQRQAGGSKDPPRWRLHETPEDGESQEDGRRLVAIWHDEHYASNRSLQRACGCPTKDLGTAARQTPVPVRPLEPIRVRSESGVSCWNGGNNGLARTE